MIPYARQSVDDADVAAVCDVLRSDFLTQGPVVPAFERFVAERCGAAHAVAVTNATAALHLAAAALGAGPGKPLWTSPNSFVASANCGRYCGAEVDFVDVDARTHNLSAEALAAKLEEAQRRGTLPHVVVTVDFAGQPCDYDAIGALRDRYGFRILEDASHAVGATYAGMPVGSGRYADATVFSFHPVKIVTTGEGGMVLTNNAALAERIALLRGHGVTRDPSRTTQPREPWEYEQLSLGYNYRLTELQAALGLSQMKRIDAFLDRRREIAARYSDALRDLPLELPVEIAQASSAFHLYPVVVQDGAPIGRRELYGRLREYNIAANVHYMPIYLQPYYRALGFEEGYCPNAERYYARALSLPMYPGLADEEQFCVNAVLRAALERN